MVATATRHAPAAWLARERASLGLTQRQLGLELGVSPMTISQWELGRNRINEPLIRNALLGLHSRRLKRGITSMLDLLAAVNAEG